MPAAPPPRGLPPGFALRYRRNPPLLPGEWALRVRPGVPNRPYRGGQAPHTEQADGTARVADHTPEAPAAAAVQVVPVRVQRERPGEPRGRTRLQDGAAAGAARSSTATLDLRLDMATIPALERAPRITAKATGRRVVAHTGDRGVGRSNTAGRARATNRRISTSGLRGAK